MSNDAIPLYQVDAFTDRPFTGNPAAVCLLPEPADHDWMQAVAAEMNLSETAFVAPLSGEPGFRLQWFTPSIEVKLCGHATLAAAHVLWEAGWLEPEQAAVFQTLSGRLEVRHRGERIEMDFPTVPLVKGGAPVEVQQALGGAALVGTWGNDAEALGEMNVVVEMADEAAVRAFVPDLAPLRSGGAPGLIVTARGTDVDFVSRYFVPSAGVDEDPVTGSIHCALGPLWAERLGKDEVVGRQVSARAGLVTVRPQGDRVLLFGQAVTVFVGELRAGAPTG